MLILLDIETCFQLCLTKDEGVSVSAHTRRLDHVRLDDGAEGELHGGGVDDSDDVAASGALEDREEGPLHAVLGVQVDDLLDVVGSLEELDAGVEGTSVGLHHDEDLVDGRGGEGPGAEGPSLGGDGGGPLPDGVHLGGAHGTAPHGGVHALGGIGDAGRGGDGSPGGGEGGAEAGLGGLGGEGGGAGDADSEREELGRELHCRGKRRGENEGRGLLRTQTVGTGVDRGLLRPTRDTHKQGQS
mmetsp:Transcript_35475/g.72602  ORF Transcript_35475/g.72602 Transcript_35475/m.72602 type:complete len:243 (+) Transcript_35475:186-914(+)